MENFTVSQLMEFVHNLQMKVIKSNKKGSIEIYRELDNLNDKLEKLNWDSVITGKKFNNEKIILKVLRFCDIINI